MLGVFEGPLAIILRSWAPEGQMLISRVEFLDVLVSTMTIKTSKNPTRETSICPLWAQDLQISARGPSKTPRMKPKTPQIEHKSHIGYGGS